MPGRYDAVVCDLLSALLDSWAPWRRVAGAVVASTERAGHYKPHPETYGLALSELGVAPERALYVAGAPYDVAGLTAAGMPVLWHDRARLGNDRNLPGLAVIDSLAPLLDHLDSPR
jgi:beta-phosphoglucomutase-like phosphatase (HAD superfamily)